MVRFVLNVLVLRNFCILALWFWATTLLTLSVSATVLPDGFAVGIGPSGTELVWTPPNPDQKVLVGGSRPEFLLAAGGSGTRGKKEVFGYPREVDGTLVLILSNEQQDLLTTQGKNLEVWTSGRRGALGALFIDPAAAAAHAAAATAINPTTVATPTPTVAVDPAAIGSIKITGPIAYSLPDGLQLSTPDFPIKLEVVGEVIHPETLTSQHPLVLFLHGRHGTCYNNENEYDSVEWPCPENTLPIPSHEGYSYIAKILASQGNVVVSISANGINGQDYLADDGGASARSILIRHHLALWAKWHSSGGDPWTGALFKGKLDMNNVVLVGHSRGGEGIHRAAIDASPSDPFKIVGLVSYGPTAFGRQVTPDIHSLTILPTCDGDVFDLQGQAYVDASRDIAYSEALRSAVIALGCNHNYFNTEWTPGLSRAPSYDDWFNDDDPVCGSNGGSVRLTPQEQQVVGATYTAALVRMAVKQDGDMLQLLDGSFVRPKAIGRADVAVNTVGGAAYRLLYRPDDEGSPTIGGGMTGGECRGYDIYFDIGEDACGIDDDFVSDDDFFFFDYFFSPHWTTYFPTFLLPMAIELSWTSQGAYTHFDIPMGKRDLSQLDWVDVRVANDPNNEGAELEMSVLDNLGKYATVPVDLPTVEGWPGEYDLDKLHARTLRGRLGATLGVNLGNIVAVQLKAKNNSGRVWVLDIAASQSKIKQPAVLDLPVISLEAMSTPEGNGVKTFNIKVSGNKPLSSPGTIWLEKSDNEGFQINLAAGSSTQVAQVPYSFIGDKIYSPDSISESWNVVAMKGVVTGNYIGGITVVEDDPVPTLSVKSSRVTAKEGKSLIWELRLSAPTTGISFLFVVVPPSSGKELASNDVPNSWLQTFSGQIPSTPTPLSDLSIFVDVSFGYGVTKTTLTVPIASDGMAEDEESIVLEGYGLKDERVTLVGKVPKHKKMLR